MRVWGEKETEQLLGLWGLNLEDTARQMGWAVHTIKKHRSRLIREGRAIKAGTVSDETMAAMVIRAKEGASYHALMQEFGATEYHARRAITKAGPRKIIDPVLTAERDALAEKVRELVAAGSTDREVAAALGLMHSRVYKIRQAYGIQQKSKEQRISERAVERKAKAIRVRPTHSEWKPRNSLTDIERAVDKLRCLYAIVCAEATISRPYQTPKPYTIETRFRVGNRRNVPAAELLRLANG